MLVQNSQLASLLILVSCFGQSLSRSVSLQRAAQSSSSSHPASRDAYILDEGTDNDEGEDHDDINVPDGADFISIPLKDGHDETFPIFITEDVDKDEVDSAYIIVHGKLRNGNDYWETLNNAIDDARDDDFPNTDRHMAVAAAQFFSTELNSGQYDSDDLAWDEINAWQAGEAANHPDDTEFTSIDALNAMVALFTDEDEYPELKNITVVGHGGGGQLVQRYAVLADDPPDHVHIRYIHGDPSSCLYFTNDRPTRDDEDLPSMGDCPSYNTWRYGFAEFPYGPGDVDTARNYFGQYISRDVVSLVGKDDTEESGDQTCMAIIQGGEKRRDRNMLYAMYINTLAGTDADFDDFPGEFGELPDWSDVSGGEVGLRLLIVEDAAHNAEELFATNDGRAALFYDHELPEGWRPS